MKLLKKILSPIVLTLSLTAQSIDITTHYATANLQSLTSSMLIMPAMVYMIDTINLDNHTLLSHKPLRRACHTACFLAGLIHSGIIIHHAKISPKKHDKSDMLREQIYISSAGAIVAFFLNAKFMAKE
jgi:hypothetical protein